ncbi:MAG TPA: hypothetical protein PKV71_11960 [Calditrichia bacterium]|nr:hypothetical protein [Calditrichota bacterium]HQU72313.1 hypothetical protein [Calditrichia bacterium]HQV32588.1 hypothetical protein [Calditrichia bacterium]
MFIKPGRKNRQYSYEPRFYKPEVNEDGTPRRRISFQRSPGYGRGMMGKGILPKVLGIGLVIYLLYLFTQWGSQ